MNFEGLGDERIIVNGILDAAKNQHEENISDNLKIVLTTSEKLRKLKETDIRFTQPIVKQGDDDVIFPHTINVIQGQAGVHKSRLAEVICSSLLKLHSCNNKLLGFKRTNFDTIYTVVYVDTERNQSEQLPYALQSIQINAGYNKVDHPSNFEYVSLLEIKRSERYKTLNEYLDYIRQQTDKPLFIVLDVSTDCIEDFNKTDKSMELIDLMNISINRYNVTFLCLIHENPKSDKARGHFGTELMNKSSTVMQVGFEKDANQNNTDLIRVKYLKCRSTARHQPFYFKYSIESKGLILADASEISLVVNNRKKKANIEDVGESISTYLSSESSISKQDLFTSLRKDFEVSPRTIEDRVKEIIDSDFVILNEKGEACKLAKEQKEKMVYYKLIPNESIDF